MKTRYYYSREMRRLMWLAQNATGTVIETSGYPPYYTPDALFDKGMCACGSCGAINSLDDHRCYECDEPRFVIRKKS